MKNLLFIIATAILISGCKKEKTPEPAATPVDTSDKTAPVITLKGKVKDTISLGITYADAGATGMDNKDGDISAFIVVSGSININQTGDYQLEYNLRDAAGNLATKVIRSIHVKNEAYYLVGDYNVACSSSTINPGVDPTVYGNSTYTANVAISSTVNNKIMISQLNVGPVFVVPYTNVGGNSMSVSYTDFSYPAGTCSGTINATKTGFTISTVTYNQSYPNKFYNTTSVFTKK